MSSAQVSRLARPPMTPGQSACQGLRVVTTLPRTPRMNAICERVIGSLRRELLDRILILDERHLARMLQEYLIRYNGRRPHQSRQQRPRPPQRNPPARCPTSTTCNPSAEDRSLQA
ncbi:integrase core domain-containing protein [Nonomuraea angiospora]|uniref:integrase core domain-containing protein n=1 Tax=Nonomuraea angiospora TaxID=46172 RepID=UPI00343705A9